MKPCQRFTWRDIEMRKIIEGVGEYKYQQLKSQLATKGMMHHDSLNERKPELRSNYKDKIEYSYRWIFLKAYKISICGRMRLGADLGQEVMAEMNFCKLEFGQQHFRWTK